MNGSSRGKNLWKYGFSILSVFLWIITIVLFFKSNSSYDTTDYEAQREIMDAMRWLPACCIGAIISTLAAYVIFELLEYIDDQRKITDGK